MKSGVLFVIKKIGFRVIVDLGILRFFGHKFPLVLHAFLLTHLSPFQVPVSKIVFLSMLVPDKKLILLRKTPVLFKH